MYYTYVLIGQDKDTGKNKLYTGSTGDLANRVREHKSGEIKTTKRLNNVSLIYYEACLNKTDARKRELQLKTGFGRGYIKRRLEGYLKNAGLVQW